MDLSFLDGIDRLVSIDMETTGNRTPSHRDMQAKPKFFKAPGLVIEIGCVELLRDGDRWTKGETWQTKVQPDAPIRPDSIRVHNIRPGDLKGAPRFPEIIGTMEDFFRDSPLLAHAYENEMGFLNYEYCRAGKRPWGEYVYPQQRFICTQEMSWTVFPGQSGSLDAVVDRLWIDRSERMQYHGALLDADLTADAFIEMLTYDGPKPVRSFG